MYGAIYGPDKIRPAGALAALGLGALFDLGHTLDLMAYQLLADPAMPLVLPAPARPSFPAATADNGVVHLAWVESPDAVAGYHVYRTADLGQPYARVTATPQR